MVRPEWVKEDLGMGFKSSLVNYCLVINYRIETGLSMKVLKMQGL